MTRGLICETPFSPEVEGHLSDADTGKHNEIAAPQWARDDADIAHVTGWFSIPHAWGHFVGPSCFCGLTLKGLSPRQHQLANRFPRRFPRNGARRGRKSKHDWGEAEMVLTVELDRRGDFEEEGQTDDWNCKARAERLIANYFLDNGKECPTESEIRKR